MFVNLCVCFSFFTLSVFFKMKIKINKLEKKPLPPISILCPYTSMSLHLLCVPEELYCLFTANTCHNSLDKNHLTLKGKNNGIQRLPWISLPW